MKRIVKRDAKTTLYGTPLFTHLMQETNQLKSGDDLIILINISRTLHEFEMNKISAFQALDKIKDIMNFWGNRG